MTPCLVNFFHLNYETSLSFEVMGEVLVEMHRKKQVFSLKTIVALIKVRRKRCFL